MIDTYLDMKNIIPVSDLQRQAAQILLDVNKSSEPIIITQRGRPAAVLISTKRYAQIEEDLELLDDLELAQMLQQAERERLEGKTLSHEEVKRRLGFKE